MHTKFLIYATAFFFSFSSFGQAGRMKSQKKDQVKALKVAFITTELSLTTAESEKFWPIYNKFDDGQFALRQEKLEAFNRRMDEEQLNDLSDKEASDLLRQLDSAEDELHLLRKKLTADLKPVIGPLKILKLKKAESDFNRKLLKQYRQGRKK